MKYTFLKASTVPGQHYQTSPPVTTMTLGQDSGSRDTVIAAISREELSEKKDEAGALSNSHCSSSSPSQALRDESKLVTWDGPDDPDNPHNWSIAYRWWATLLCAVMTLNVYV